MHRVTLGLILVFVLAACGSVPEPITHAFDAGGSRGTASIGTALAPEALGQVLMRYNPNYGQNFKVVPWHEHFMPSLKRRLERSRIFGGDRSSPLKLTVTMDGVSWKVGFSSQRPIQFLRLRYELHDKKQQLLYRHIFDSRVANPVDNKALIEGNVERFVNDLAVKMAQRAGTRLAAIARDKPDNKPVVVAASPIRRKSQSAALAPIELKSYSAKGVSFGKYHALIIGNNRYQSLPNLRSATGDARRLDLILRENYGFDTRLILDASRRDILSELATYRNTLGEQDNLLIFYAGHGWVDEEADEGYWLPVDAVQDNPVHWISNASIVSTIRAIRAKHVLVIADSCFSGKLTRGVKPRLQTQDFLQRMAGKSSRTALTSGGLEPVLDAGGKDGHSVFAGALFAALNANTAVIDMSQLFGVIRRSVLLNADQLPQYGDIRRAGHDGGDFLFVRTQ